MPQPAARLTDLHTCPMIDPVTATPHVGGPITAPGLPDRPHRRASRGPHR